MERQKGWLTSGAFASFCGTTKETLRHYKDIGLLSPAHRGDNNYFYYDIEQLYTYYAISIFRQAGTPLEEIRRCLQSHDVAETLAQLNTQRERLDMARRQLEQMDFVLSGMIRNLELVTAPDMVPRIARFEREHLLALPAEELACLAPPAANEDELLIAALTRCRALCQQHGLQTDYQLGAIHLPGKTVGQDTITHLYTRLKEPADFSYYQEKPAGNYLYLCCLGRWDLSEGYATLDQYIQEHSLPVVGNFYASDLAGLLLNGEENAASIISVRLTD